MGCPDSKRNGGQRKLRAGQIVLYQGEAVAHSFRVTSGLVRAYIIHDSGDEATVALFAPGDIFPIATSFDIAPVTLFYYETVADSDLELMNQDEFSAYIEAMTVTDIQLFAKRYAGALLHIDALLQATAEKKLLHTFRYLAMRFGTSGLSKRLVKISIKLTQHDIAMLAGLSRETVSIELGKLRASQVVQVSQKIYTIDIMKLNKAFDVDAGIVL